MIAKINSYGASWNQNKRTVHTSHYSFEKAANYRYRIDINTPFDL